mmetsp:Transcript_43417/g.71017  ORF Transcript_43417/g.71017 Transcript_43417/m.71017 type:complete len:98 (+) Transcript_43417:282-575(+)
MAQLRSTSTANNKCCRLLITAVINDFKMKMKSTHTHTKQKPSSIPDQKYCCMLHKIFLEVLFSHDAAYILVHDACMCQGAIAGMHYNGDDSAEMFQG